MDLMDFTEKNGRIIHFSQDFQPLRPKPFTFKNLPSQGAISNRSGLIPWVSQSGNEECPNQSLDTTIRAQKYAMLKNT
ncbi:hypothetical protein [Nitrosospira sp. Nsp1]|uniref:hypothetical protein n=1 Tax=Nitrosospira sp. Nsp1 TaxID=136547 RepID=UPI00115FBB87|nr:hypothetical protein [Nitrosospira sp. Nsp1]